MSDIAYPEDLEFMQSAYVGCCGAFAIDPTSDEGRQLAKDVVAHFRAGYNSADKLRARVFSTAAMKDLLAG